MPREREGYRDQLAQLYERFPNREVLYIKEVCDILNCHRRTVLGTKGFPMKKLGTKYMVSVSELARWMVSYK